MDLESKKIFSHKIKSSKELVEIIGGPPRQKKVIMCHGTFDVVHPGHIRHLLYAKTKADVLVASITADEHIKKGNLRPYVPQDLRAINVAALEMVDYVIIDKDPTPLKNLSLLRPDFFAKGYEYTSGAVNPKTQEEMDIVNSYGGEFIFTPGDIVYSSSNLLNLERPNIAIEKLITLMSAENITFDDLRNALKKFEGVKITIVGDTIVDSYTYCSMIGGMTKTPTMSVRYENKVDFVGGAAVVAKHMRSAGAEVNFITVLGKDPHQEFVLSDLAAHGVACIPFIDSTRPTTNKNAIVAEGYRLLKIDTLDNRSISEKILHGICEKVSTIKSEAVVFSDFRHGIFNKHTIDYLCKAIPPQVMKVADSQVASRWGNILDFNGFDLITPNEKEARFALGDQDSVIRPLATELLNRSGAKVVVLKCGARGIVVCRAKDPIDYGYFFVIESFADRIVDAVGAGDALLAYLTIARLVTGNDVIAAILGNMAAGIECEYDGNQPITPALMLKKIEHVESLAKFEALN